MTCKSFNPVVQIICHFSCLSGTVLQLGNRKGLWGWGEKVRKHIWSPAQAALLPVLVFFFFFFGVYIYVFTLWESSNPKRSQADGYVSEPCARWPGWLKPKVSHKCVMLYTWEEVRNISLIWLVNQPDSVESKHVQNSGNKPISTRKVFLFTDSSIPSIITISWGYDATAECSFCDSLLKGEFLMVWTYLSLYETWPPYLWEKSQPSLLALWSGQ